ncbi:MAG: mechanosensitive ion channel family protein [Gammaproteobacteria bacterium]|nr:mechanosensitive ion channel family protein [Gammaproteobacteria bacterium]
MEESFPQEWWQLAIGLGALVVLAVIADWMKSRVLSKALGRVASEAEIALDKSFFDKNVLGRLAPIIPALVVYYGIVPALGMTRAEAEAGLAPGYLILFWTAVRRLTAAFIVLTLARTVSAFVGAFHHIYMRAYSESIARPIKGYVQVATLVIYVIAGVLMVATLLGRSPLVFLSGIGALAAVLMVVFRNTLVSFAASIQITSNDILRIGDWVEVPQVNANGTVVDIDLHTVRVQNWDKTISTIPTQRLIAESFKNWRGMSESGGRRIKRAILIDVNSVRFLDDDEIRELSRRERLRAHIGDRLDEVARSEPSGSGGDGNGTPEASQRTNLELFRAYVEGYLRAHPKTHQEMTLMVRQLAPGPHGAPIEIYCFSNDTEWLSYEAFQSKIFDHLFAILPEFGLRAFQERSGSDLPRRRDALAPVDGDPKSADSPSGVSD